MRSAVMVAFIMACGATAFAQELPDGPGKDVAVRVCGQCHEPQRAASVRLTREGWEGVLAKMTDLGMEASEDELKQLVAMLESPVNKKYAQLGPEMQGNFQQKLVADARPLIEPRLQALDAKVRASLTASAAASASAPAPAKAPAPKKAASK